MQLKVGVGGGTIAVDVDASDLIFDVVKKCQPGEAMRLFSGWRPLHLGRTLAEYNITASTADLQLAPIRETALDITALLQVRVPPQELVGEVDAFHLGLGSNAQHNLGLRKRLGKPGAPFGGIGFFDPQVQALDGENPGPPPHVTAAFVREAKLQEFTRCARGEPSMYYWGLQPVYAPSGRVLSAEVLVRARNGSNSAPYEDLKVLMDPDGPAEQRKVYVEWKATEMVDWPLRFFKEQPELLCLNAVLTNVRPADMRPGGWKSISKKSLIISSRGSNLN
jgi:hypothetical protein